MGFYLISNILAVKQIAVFGVVVPGGVLAIPWTFLVTDIVTEVYGKRAAQSLVRYGFVVMGLVLGVTIATVYLPAADFWPHQAAFATVLLGTLRITLASFGAYIVSQIHDVWAFDKWKQITQGKYLWLRNNASTIVSQALDSVLFIGLAFFGTMPFRAVLALMLSQWLVKVVLALLDTPFCYLGVAWARR